MNFKRIFNRPDSKNNHPNINVEKILFLLQTPPPVHGSSMVGKYIKESQLICTFFESRFINLGISRSINEIGNKNFNKLLRYLSILVHTFLLLVTFKPKLCYVAITAKGVAFYKDVLVVLLIKLSKVKLIYHFHNKGVSTRQDRFIDNFLYRFVFKNSDAILLSKSLYPDVQKYFPETKVHICPNGIPKLDIPLFQKSRQKNKNVKILFLSNLIESKGVFVLLEACSILKQNEIPFECDFIGGEGDITAAQFQNKLQVLGLTNEINYLGRKYGEEKSKALSDADFFAFPTYYHNECFPLVLLEAMQHELAVVSTYEGGINDIVEEGKTGYLVQQKNAQALAKKLEILINSNELRCKLGKAGRKKYEQEFTLLKFESRLLEILNQMVCK